MAPSDVRSFAVAVEKLTAFAATFGVQVPSPQAAASFYRQQLGDLPADLLMEAVDATIGAWVYQSLPKPAEIRRYVTEAMSRRTVELGRLEMALKRIRPPAQVGSRRFDVRQAVKPLASATIEQTDGLTRDQMSAYWGARLDGKTPAEARALATESSFEAEGAAE